MICSAKSCSPGDGSASRETFARTSASHASGIVVSAAMRARRSPERLVSWVWVTSSPSPKRRARTALAAWKSATDSPKRLGSPPTSLRATIGIQR